ncbi:MAG TPA: hypothetical protein VG370_31580 [Chloroflexota bacterium]|nr:hypothetical protein [Chloroflexota bacterium]
MAFALRCLFFLAALVLICLLLYLYRRRVNMLLVALLAAYTIGVGLRLLRTEADGELVWQSLLAVAGLGLVWVVVWLGARWLERRVPPERD